MFNIYIILLNGEIRLTHSLWSCSLCVPLPFSVYTAYRKSYDKKRGHVHTLQIQRKVTTTKKKSTSNILDKLEWFESLVVSNS